MWRTAAVFAQDNTCQRGDIGSDERRSERIALIFANENIDIGNTLLFRYGDTLEQDLDRYARLFGEPLPTPLVIRVYPDRDYFICLNRLETPPAEGAFHSHTGLKEIVLIGDEIDRALWADNELMLNTLRFELAAQFVQQLTNGKAPLGLAEGIALYAEDPAYVSQSYQPSQQKVQAEIDKSWRTIWEDTSGQEAAAFTSMTTVAYLVDAYGWPKFLKFLNNLSTAESYHAAAHDAFGVDLALLHQPWEKYYTVFLNGRWRANVFYGFDFSDFEHLIAEGAYADAIAGLGEAISFLKTIEDSERVQYATSLLATAEKGQQAGQLVRETRQALQDKEYSRTIALADETEEIYRSLGDERRLDELAGYRAWAEDVLALQTRMSELEAEVTAGHQIESTITEMLEVTASLGEKGYEPAQSRAERSMALLEQRKMQRESEELSFWAKIVVGLLALRVVLILLRPPKETKLI